MGREISTYVDAVVTALQDDYGERWMIRKRGESAEAVSGKPWGVQVGYAALKPLPRDDSGMDLELTCGATVHYAGVGPTHNDGFQESDIAASLAAWLASHVVEGQIAYELEIDSEPLAQVRGGVEVPTGQYLSHVFWNVKLDDIDPDITIEGYVTRHPTRPQARTFYYEIELADGTRRVVTYPEGRTPELPDNGVRVRQIVIADPQNVPATTDTTVYYPALVENEVE